MAGRSRLRVIWAVCLLLDTQGTLIEGFRLSVSAPVHVQEGQIAKYTRRLGSSRPKGVLDGGQGTLQERFGFVIPALNAVELGQVSTGGSGIAVMMAERLLAEGQGPLIERFGLGIGALQLIELGQVLANEAGGGKGNALFLFGDRQGSP